MKLDKVRNAVSNHEKGRKDLENELNENSSASTFMSLRNHNFKSFSAKTVSPIFNIYIA
jgi:hypothetical protein